jgi:hypothetical protein
MLRSFCACVFSEYDDHRFKGVGCVLVYALLKTYINIGGNFKHDYCSSLPVCCRADTNFVLPIRGRACLQAYSVHKAMARAASIETLSPCLGWCSVPFRGEHCILQKGDPSLVFIGVERYAMTQPGTPTHLAYMDGGE